MRQPSHWCWRSNGNQNIHLLFTENILIFKSLLINTSRAHHLYWRKINHIILYYLLWKVLSGWCCLEKCVDMRICWCWLLRCNYTRIENVGKDFGWSTRKLNNIRSRLMMNRRSIAKAEYNWLQKYRQFYELTSWDMIRKLKMVRRTLHIIKIKLIEGSFLNSFITIVNWVELEKWG